MEKFELHIHPISVNGKTVSRIVVDEHCRKHRDITDDVIIDLVRLLDGVEQLPDDVKPPYEYYATLVLLKEKQYRIVWLLEERLLYLGIITIYRDSRRQ